MKIAKVSQILARLNERGSFVEDDEIYVLLEILAGERDPCLKLRFLWLRYISFW